MLSLDSTTTAEYAAASGASNKAQAVIDALTGTVTVKIYDGAGAEKASGTMAAPWATQANGTITVGEFASMLSVSAAGPPDANWYLRFEGGGRWLRGSFGLRGSSANFRSTSDAWIVGHTGSLGTVVINAPSGTAPSWLSAPTSLQFSAGVGGSHDFSAYVYDPEGGPFVYALIGTAYSGMSLNASSGVLTVTSAAAAATRNLTIRVTDSTGLSSDWPCAVTIAANAVTHAVSVSGSTVTTRRLSDNQTWTGSTINGSTIGAGPGSIIEFAAGTYPPLKITNLVGNAANRVTVRNSGGLVTIRRGSASSGGFVVEMSGCSYATFDGSGAGQTYGIKVTSPSVSDSPTSYVKFSGLNHHVTWRHFEIDGLRTSWGSSSTPIGLQGHDQNVTRAGSPGVFQQHDVLVENFYARRLSGEGIYFGPNYSSGASPLRDIEVRNGIIEDCGRDAIQVKCWFEGANSIHHLAIQRCGRNTADPQAGQRFGISVLSGLADVHDNSIAGSGESGIQLYVQNGPDDGASFNGFGPYSEFICRAYNNLITDSGVIDAAPVNTGHGITVGADDPARTFVLPYLYNNTCADNEGDGINIGSNSAAGWLRNNVLIGNAGGAYSAGPSSASNNKTSGTLTAAYRLTAEDAAVGSLGTDISMTDLDGVSRAGTASKGAYEYT